jgi:hypothetical protein
MIIMKNKFLPVTRKGTWAVGLFGLFLVLGIAANRISDYIGNTIEYPNPINSPLLGSVLYLAFGAAISASIVGLVATKRDNENSISVYLAIPLGFVFMLVIIVFGIANLTHGTNS